MNLGQSYVAYVTEFVFFFQIKEMSQCDLLHLEKVMLLILGSDSLELYNSNSYISSYEIL